VFFFREGDVACDCCVEQLVESWILHLKKRSRQPGCSSHKKNKKTVVYNSMCYNCTLIAFLRCEKSCCGQGTKASATGAGAAEADAGARSGGDAEARGAVASEEAGGRGCL
jgi:hypothetical protein